MRKLFVTALLALSVSLGIAVGSLGTAQAAPVARMQDFSPCHHRFSGDEMRRLIELSDPARLRDLYDAHRKVTEITGIFTRYRDYRGLFAIYYRDTLDAAIPELEDAHYQDMEWAWAASVDFVRRYLSNLHWHLTDGPITPWWRHHYDLAANCSLSPGRVMTSALNAHLIEDFPRALAFVGTEPRHTADFFAIGDDLIPTTPTIVADVEEVYGYDMTPFFRLYFVSDVVDPVLGEGTTSYVFSQVGRGQAFTYGLLLGASPDPAPVLAQMRASFLGTEAAMDGLAAAGLL